MKYVTKEGWVLTEVMLKNLKKELPNLSTEEILRMVDLFKAGLIKR